MQILAPILSQLINNSNPVSNSTVVPTVAPTIDNTKIYRNKIEVDLNKVDNDIDELKKKLNL